MDETREPDGPPPVPGVEIFDDLAPAPVAPIPTPAEAPTAPEGPRPAHPALRAFAFTLDGAATVAITIVAVIALLDADYGVAFSPILAVPTLAALLATVLTATLGVTPAKALLGLRVVDAVTGRPPGWRAIPRSLVIVAPLLLNLLLAATIGDVIWNDVGLAVFLSLPIVLWVALLVVVSARRSDRYRGLQDLAARTVVVMRR
jgi:uncharacterized RDD family membrane protein YckC